MELPLAAANDRARMNLFRLLLLGFLAPARMPRAIVRQFNSTLNRVLKEPDIRAKLAIAGSDVLISTPESHERKNS